MSLQVLEKHPPIVHSQMQPTESNARQAEYAVNEYVKEYIGPSFQVVNDRRNSDNLRRRFFVRCKDGPVGIIFFDSDRAQIIEPTEKEIRLMRDKATILSARTQGILPLNQHGFVLAEYARRQAEQYLGQNVAMFFNAADPVFVLNNPALWQTTIVLKMYDIGPFALGFLDVDAKTGQVAPLTQGQIDKMKERANAIVGFHTQGITEYERSSYE